MILVDANQIAISHLMVRSKIENGIYIDSVRKSIIRVLARIHKKFKMNSVKHLRFNSVANSAKFGQF